MKILYDHQTFTLQNYGGISRYFFELYNRFNTGNEKAEVSLLLSNNAYLNSKNYPKTKSFFPGKKFKGKSRIQKEINQLNSIRLLKSNNFDIFHPTYYNTYFLKHLKNKPFVVTFLDMIHEKFGHRFPDLAVDKSIFNQKKTLLENAAKVISISESTKRDIIEFFGISGNNIEVIYLGNSLQSTNQNEAARLIEPDYILFVGNRGSYKNFSFYLSAVASILIENDLSFVCAGGGAFTAEEIILFENLGVINLMKSIPIEDQILSNLYSNAIAFCFPSLYEGFGIPVLEAFACGCPCLLSDGGSLSEIGGEAAVYFDPENVDEMRITLNEILNNSALRINLINNGYERLKKFSWEKTYHETINLYQSIL